MNQIFDQSDNLISSDYYDIPEFKKMKIREQQDFSALHLNISSISTHINDLRNFLNLVNQKIVEFLRRNPETTNIDLPGYKIEQTPTESSAGGVLIYISLSLSYKTSKELKSVFIELLIPNMKNHLAGVI